MRIDGGRNWLDLTRRTLVLACVLAFTLTATAAAATRYAVPAGGLASGACGVGNECTLKWAVEQAGGGDTVNVAAGTYTVASPIAGSNVTVVGAGVGQTVVVGNAGLGGPVLSLANPSVVRRMTIESAAAPVALDLAGQGDQLAVYSNAGGAMILRGGSDLNNSVVYTSAASATALRVSGGLLSSTTVRHSTIVASGGGSTAVDGSGLLASLSIQNSIANGVGTDVAGDLLNAASVLNSAYRTANSIYATNVSGNRNAAAAFVDLANRNFQQTAASTGVNTGQNADGVLFDIEGRPRTIAEGTDIGAYELPIPPSASTGAASLITGTSARVAATVNPRATDTSYEIKYGKTSPPTQSSGSVPLGSGTANVMPDTDLGSLTPASTYYYRVVASSEWGETEGPILTFNTPSIAPVSTTDAASSVTATSARLNGRANPGGAATQAQFEWGTTAAYGSTTTLQDLGSGTSTLNLAGETLTGLTPATQYFYRVTAVNPNGTVTGLQGTFTTLTRQPITTTSAATGVTTSDATVHGSVDPGGALTSWQFEYGVGGYDTTVSGVDLTGVSPQAVSKPLTGLLPGTTYSYRLVAQNLDGTVNSTGTFATAIAQPTATTGGPNGVTARGATVGGTLNPGGDAATYRFEYSKNTSYSQSTPTVNVPDGTDDVTASTTLTGLEPGTLYHYRLAVDNSAGEVRGAGSTFTTAVAQPGAATDRATGVEQTAAHLVGTINPGAGTTDWWFEYGRTSAYGQSSTPETMGVHNRDEKVVAKVEGLEPGATYHFRVLARNAAGLTVGEDAAFTAIAPDQPSTTDSTDVDEPVDDVPAEEPAPGERQVDGLAAPDPTPPVGRSANAAPAGGTVRVRVPGSDDFVELTEGAGIPIGSVVDATDGTVTITSAANAKGATQTANFGGSEFKVLQKRSSKPITDIVLTGGSFNDCFPRALARRETMDVFAAGRRKWSRRRLWGNGHGRFRTRGRHGTATVRGTHWLTEDRCDGTLVRVKRGLVEVRDLERRRTVMVGTGEQYVAKSLRYMKARAKARRRK